MRYILIILVFLSVGANAQMVIKAHANYRPFISGNLLLDQYSGAASAYSLRKLLNAYTGAAIRVRKDTTGQPEQDVFFTTAGDLDTAALKSFLNARSGFVTTWYDQVTANNLIMTVQANQPRIALNGVIERQNNKVSIFYNGTSHRLDVSSTFFTNVSNGFTFSVSSRSANNATEGCVFQVRTGLATSRAIVSYRISAAGNQGIGAGGRRLDANSFQAVGTNAYNGNLLLASAHFNWGSAILNIFENGASAGTLNPFQTAGNTSNTGGNLFVGSSGTTNFLNGYISELILYSIDQSTNRTLIEANINAYYSIY